MIPNLNDTLDAIRTTLRISMQRVWTSNGQSYTSLMNDKQSGWESHFMLFASAFCYGKSWLVMTSTKRAIQANPAKAQEFQDMADLYYSLWHVFRDKFALEVDYSFYSDVGTLIQNGVNRRQSADRIIRSLKRRMDRWAQDSFNYIFNDYTARGIQPYEVNLMLFQNNDYIEVGPHFDTLTSTTRYPHYDNRFYRLQNALTGLFNVLRDLRTPIEVLRFVCNSGVGSSGVHFAGEIRFPFIKPFFPATMSGLARRRIGNTRDLGDVGTRGTVTDDCQEDMENKFNAKLMRLRTTYDPIHNHESRESDEDPTPSQSDGEGETNRPIDPESGTGPDTATTGGPNPENPRPTPVPDGTNNGGGGDGGDGNAIPDDDGYEPDGFLARKARLFTLAVRAQDANDLSHDHMRRFTVNNENPTNIRRVNLTPDDFRFQVDDWRGTVMYLVTYTRKSKKPIFNLVV